MTGPYPTQGDPAPPSSDYPVQYDVEYPDRQLNRLTTFFRIFVVIPIAIVLGAVSGATYSYGSGGDYASYGAAAGGFVLLGACLVTGFFFKAERP